MNGQTGPQPPLDEKRKEQIGKKAEEVVKVLQGVPIADLGPIFGQAQQIVMEKTRI